MTTYVYETIPQNAAEEPEYFEVQQCMKDAPLATQPGTGKPVRRVILGGYGVLKSGGASSDKESSGEQGGCCCGSGGCCD